MKVAGLGLSSHALDALGSAGAPRLSTASSSEISLNDTVLGATLSSSIDADDLLDCVKKQISGEASPAQVQAVTDGIAALMKLNVSPVGLSLTAYLAGDTSLEATALLGKLLGANDDFVRNAACKALLQRAEGDSDDALSARVTLEMHIDKAEGSARKDIVHSLIACTHKDGRAHVERLLAGKNKACASAVAQVLACKAKDETCWPIILDMAKTPGPHRARLVETLHFVLHQNERAAFAEHLLQGDDAKVLAAIFKSMFASHVFRDAAFASLLVPHLDKQEKGVAKRFAEAIASVQTVAFAEAHAAKSDALCIALLSSSHASSILQAERAPSSAHMARQFLNMSKQANGFESKPLLREAQMRRWLDVVIKPDAIEEMKRLVLHPLMFVRDHVQKLLSERFSEVTRTIDSKNFDKTNDVHMVVAYLRALAQPHAFKFLSGNSYFDFETWTNIVKRGGTHDALALEPLAVDHETKYLGYEAHLFMKRVVDPGRARARALGLPFMLVANVSYGGTLVSILPLRRLQSEGVKVVFTKMSSSIAHGQPDCMDDKLFTPEQMRYILQHQPIIAVADGSTSRHYPDGLRGYHNFGLLLNETLGVGTPNIAHQPGVTLKAYPKLYRAEVREALGTLREEVGAQARPHVASGLSSRLSRMMTRSDGQLPRGYGIYYHATNGAKLHTEFGDKPALLDWGNIRGPAIVNVFTSMSSVFMMRQRYKVEWAAWKTYLSARGKPHRRAYYDDRDEQAPRALMGRRGLKFKPVAIHRPARAHFKALQGD